MPVSRTDTDFGPGAGGESAARVPGVPSYMTNQNFAIATGVNDDMILTSSEGGPVTVTCDQGSYTGATLATELQTQMNADNTLTGTGTITFAVTYNEATNEFTLDATTGNTIAYTDASSTAGATFGFTADVSAAQSITSDTPTSPTGTITFDFATNGNDSVVTYAIYDNTTGGYLKVDGSTNGGSEVWATHATWANGGQAGRVTATGLSTLTAYTFKVKARSEGLVETAFSSDSSSMYAGMAIDWGTASTSEDREIATGNTKVEVDGVTDSDGTEYSIYVNGTYGAIPATFSLQNVYSTTSRVQFQFSEDNSTWANVTDFYTITSANDVMNFTSDQGGPVDIDIPDSAYDDGDALATALQTAMNANNTLTGTGTITFAVSYSSTTGKYTIDAGAGHTIALNYFDSDAAYGLGFTGNASAAQTITSDESRGESPRVLTTSPAGVEHTFYWDSYSDAGKSEKDTSVYLRAIPYDVSPSGGNAGATVTSDAFSVNNRPVQITLLNVINNNYGDYDFDDDTTPVFAAVMGAIRGGDALYFRLTVYNYSSALVFSRSSAVDLSGWEYEDSPGSWNAVTINGVDPRYVDGTNRIRYTVQAADALTQTNDQPYSVTIEQGEVRDRG